MLILWQSSQPVGPVFSGRDDPTAPPDFLRLSDGQRG